MTDISLIRRDVAFRRGMSRVRQREFPYVTAVLLLLCSGMFLMAFVRGLASHAFHSVMDVIGFGSCWYGIDRQLGSLTPTLFAQGQDERLITYMFLHLGVLHFALNMAALLGAVKIERAFGHLRFLLLYLTCQPHSLAGRRKAGADERDLWPEFSRLIRELRPAWVLAENVPGLRTSDAGRFFGGILRDLAEIGYDAEWTVLSAAQFGAPHQRERIFIVAYPTRTNSAGRRRRSGDTPLSEVFINEPDDGDPLLADPASQQQPGHQARVLHGQRGQHTGDGQEVVRCAHRQAGTDLARSDDESVADPTSTRLPLRRQPGLTASDTQARAGVEHQPQRCNETLVNAHYAGRQERDAPAKPGRESLPAWGYAENGSLWQPEPRLGGMLAGLPSRLDGYRWPARPGESQAAWEPPRVVTEKKINRVARLKALGNAIVPQCAEYIAHCILTALQEDEEVAV